MNNLVASSYDSCIADIVKTTISFTVIRFQIKSTAIIFQLINNIYCVLRFLDSISKLFGQYKQQCYTNNTEYCNDSKLVKCSNMYIHDTHYYWWCTSSALFVNHIILAQRQTKLWCTSTIVLTVGRCYIKHHDYDIMVVSQ